MLPAIFKLKSCFAKKGPGKRVNPYLRGKRKPLARKCLVPGPLGRKRKKPIIGHKMGHMPPTPVSDKEAVADQEKVSPEYSGPALWPEIGGLYHSYGEK